MCSGKIKTFGFINSIFEDLSSKTTLFSKTLVRQIAQAGPTVSNWTKRGEYKIELLPKTFIDSFCFPFIYRHVNSHVLFSNEHI